MTKGVVAVRPSVAGHRRRGSRYRVLRALYVFRALRAARLPRRLWLRPHHHFYGFSLFSLAASMRYAAMAAGRRPGWALSLAAAAIVHVVILALLR